MSKFENGKNIMPTFLNKEIISFQEATQYLDISESSLYKMTSENRITFYKPNNGKIYFKKTDLDNWMLQNEVRSISLLETEVINKISGHGK